MEPSMTRVSAVLKSLALMVLVSPCAYAGGLRSADYSVYIKNGAPFILPKDKILIIYHDINIPIKYTPDLPAFVINPLGGGLSPTTVKIRDITQDPSYVLSGYLLHEGDFNGDGQTDFFLQAPDASAASYVLIPSLPVAESLSDLTRRDIFEVRIADKNSDGRADINIYRDGAYVRTLVASSTGDFLLDNGTESEESKKAKKQR
jgi:hypothetical protein